MQKLRRTYLAFEQESGAPGSLERLASELSMEQLQKKIQEYLGIHSYGLAVSLIGEARKRELKSPKPDSKILEAYDDMEVSIKRNGLSEAGKEFREGRRLIGVRYLQESGYSTLAAAYSGSITSGSGVETYGTGVVEPLGIQKIPPARRSRDDARIEAIVKKIVAEESKNIRRASVDGPTAESIAHRIALQEVRKHERLVPDLVKKIVQEIFEEEMKKREKQ